MNMNQPSAEHLNNLYPDRTSLDIRNIYPGQIRVTTK